MPEIGAILELAKGATELANIAKTETRKDPLAADRRYISELIITLRSIYFAPEGIRSVVAKIAKGEPIGDTETTKILLDFNDAETEVHRALDRLPRKFGRADTRLSMRAEKVLRLIGWGKKGVREETQLLLNEALTFEQEISVKEAIQLLEAIDNLNEAIEDAELALREI